MGQVASITPAQGPSQIQRQDRQRVITLGASLVQGAVLGDVSQQVDRTMKETAAQWPAGYRFTLGGEMESQTETSSSSGAPGCSHRAGHAPGRPSTSRCSTP